jgi:hypothetical protein
MILNILLCYLHYDLEHVAELRFGSHVDAVSILLLCSMTFSISGIVYSLYKKCATILVIVLFVMNVLTMVIPALYPGAVVR